MGLLIFHARYIRQRTALSTLLTTLHEEALCSSLNQVLCTSVPEATHSPHQCYATLDLFVQSLLFSERSSDIPIKMHRHTKLLHASYKDHGIEMECSQTGLSKLAVR